MLWDTKTRHWEEDEVTLYHLFVNAFPPGNSLPSRNSSDAPPPVEICEILSATPAAATAETESPPPTIEVAPAFSATARATLKVPLANGGISKTPIGPFQMMVAAREISSEKSSTDSGPISKPIRFSGMFFTVCVFAPASILSATT